MKYRDGSLRKQVANGVRNLDLQDARVGEVIAFDLAAGASHAPRHALNSEKVSGRVRRGGRREKQSIAAAKIDLKRPSVAVDGLEIQRRKIIRRDDFGSCCY